MPFARPVLETVATPGANDDHTAAELRFCVLPSLNVPVKVSCCAPPAARPGPLGLKATDTSVAGLTIKVAWPLIDPDCAAMVIVPGTRPEARPAALMVAPALFVL